MQFAPSIAPLVDHLTIFQRSPQWAMPNADYHRDVSDERRWLLLNVPFYAAWHLAPGSREPVHIDYGPGTLAVPAATGTTH